MVERRAKELGIDHLIQGREDKLTALNELLEKITFDLEEIAFVGDDLPDLAIIRRVGLGITPANGNHLIASQALWQTKKSGGNGAVRDVAELILSAQSKLESVLASYQ